MTPQMRRRVAAACIADLILGFFTAQAFGFSKEAIWPVVLALTIGAVAAPIFLPIAIRIRRILYGPNDDW